MNKIINRRIKNFILISLLFLIINISISLAYLSGTVTDTESVSTVALKAGSLNIRFSSNNSEIIANNISPGFEMDTQFTITSDFGENHNYYKYAVWYKIALIIEQNEFDDDSLNYTLTLDDTSDNDGIISANVHDIGLSNGPNLSGLQIGTGAFFNNNVSHVYNLKISYNEKGTDQSHEIGCTFKAYIAIQEPELITLTFDLDGGEFKETSLDNNVLEVAKNSVIDLPIAIKEGFRFNGWDIIEGNSSIDNLQITTGNENCTLMALWSSSTYEFDYTGGEQQFVAQYSGYYKLETWGASGGDYNAVDGNGYSSKKTGGYGGYSAGTVLLSVGQKLYINCGGKGIDLTATTSNYHQTGTAGGYNGGGTGGKGVSSNFPGGSGGGGATHIALASGKLNSLSNNKSLILIVSGGGGGGGWVSNGGGGGGASGVSTTGTRISTGGTQTSGYAFGVGSNGYTGYNTSGSAEGSSGSGGGYYGGSTYNASSTATYKAVGGAGGSGYIGNSLLTDKYMYCYNCTPNSGENTKTYSTTCFSSGIAENCTRKGNGFARITYLYE